MWAEEKPHSEQSRAGQIQFFVKVWAGIVGDYVIGPNLLPFRLTERNNLLFLQLVLP